MLHIKILPMNLRDLEYNASHILVKDEDKAKTILRELEGEKSSKIWQRTLHRSIWKKWWEP